MLHLACERGADSLFALGSCRLALDGLNIQTKSLVTAHNQVMERRLLLKAEPDQTASRLAAVVLFDLVSSRLGVKVRRPASRQQNQLRYIPLAPY